MSTTSKPYRDNVDDGQYRDNIDDSSFEDVRHSLPTPEELHAEHPTAHHHGRMNKKFLGLVAMTVFAISAIIGLSVAIAARKSSKNVDSASSSKFRDDETPGDKDGFFGRNPDQDLTQRFQDMANFLDQFAFTDLKAMIDKKSPQYLAVQYVLWMANEDPAELNVPASTDYEEAMEFVQRYVMATFFFSTNGHMWEDRLDFLSDRDVCYWNNLPSATAGNNVDDWPIGVKCNEDGEVNYLYLRKYTGRQEPQHSPFIASNKLSGVLPPELGLLEVMVHFSIYGNEVTGNFPQSLQEWTELELMGVEMNKMSGPLPSWMGMWTKLRYLMMGDNQFSGPLPDGVFNAMPDLIEFSAHDNDLTGSFDKFNENTKLQTLLLQRNRLTGDIQEDTFINVPVQLLDMSDNQIGGQIPYDFYDVATVSLHKNKITGPLPTPKNGHIISFLSVYGNQMTGDLPENLGDLEWLTHLDLSQNKFTGPIPDSINSCTNLIYLYLGDNDFDGVFPDLAYLGNLEELSMRNMGLTGPIPNYVGNFLTNLVFLDLRDNQLNSAIPSSMENLEGMQYLLLSGNAFTGAVPNGLWYMQRLKVLGLDHNNFSGAVGDICADGSSEDLVWLVADSALT
eukprot:scaffold45543_cov183-Amphora_coffeaeformis.AAC.2